jgi:predicted transcriptional regulator of viral defense system
MTTRSLSTLESKLILHLEWERQPTVTIEQARQILGVSDDHARQILHRLARDRWLAQIRPGMYELIPAERGKYAFADTNPLFLGSTLVQPYYFSFATAAFFHGLSTQASFTVYIATTQDKPRRRLIRGREYRLVLQPAPKFFAWSELRAYGSLVNMADAEKTILDSLDHPEYAGDIPEIATMLWRGKSNLDWRKW